MCSIAGNFTSFISLTLFFQSNLIIISPNNGILFNGVLRPRLVNNTFALCFFINLDFLLPQTAHFDSNHVLPYLVF